jgi:transposase
MDVSQVDTLSVDEVSKRRGHDYVTVVSEPKRAGQRSRVLYVTEGKDAQAVIRAGEFLRHRGVGPDQIQRVCLDMSAAFALGVRTAFAGATMVFDHFHVVALAQAAVDQVRRRERGQFPQEPKGMRWVLLKSYEKLTPAQQADRDRVCRGKLQTGKACNQVDALRDFLKETDADLAEELLRWWCGWVRRSRIPEMKRVARTIRDHWDGIVAYLKTRVTNGAAEALNGIIQTIKRKSRGFRTFAYFRTMIYLIASKLTFDLPNPVLVTHTNSY